MEVFYHPDLGSFVSYKDDLSDLGGPYLEFAMTQHERRQSEWPIVKGQRVADFATGDGYLRSDRSLAGPLRLGTEPRVGPRGLVQGSGPSDFEMDRVTPRGFDPMGTSDTRAPAQEGSSLLSRQIRRRDR